MRVRTLCVLGLMLTSFIVMTSGSTRLAIPLVPVAVYYSLTNHWKYLAAAGLGAAALLKLKGAATVGSYLYLRDKGVLDINFDHNAAGWDSTLEKKYSRARRGVSSESSDTMSNVAGITFDPSLDDVLQYDNLGCGLRLICEISNAAVNNPQSLQDDEKIMLALFGGEKDLPNPEKASRGKLSYAYASLVGKTSKDVSSCGQVYRNCPHQHAQIMEALRAASV